MCAFDDTCQMVGAIFNASVNSCHIKFGTVLIKLEAGPRVQTILRFFPTKSIVIKSHYGESWSFDSVGELLRRNKDGFLLLEFLNGWHTKEDQEDEEECNLKKDPQGRRNLCHSLWRRVRLRWFFRGYLAAGCKERSPKWLPEPIIYYVDVPPMTDRDWIIDFALYDKLSNHYFDQFPITYAQYIDVGFLCGTTTPWLCNIPCGRPPCKIECCVQFGIKHKYLISYGRSPVMPALIKYQTIISSDNSFLQYHATSPHCGRTKNYNFLFFDCIVIIVT